MAGDHSAVVDALPYVDKGYDEPGIREAALTLVFEEMKRYRPTKNYLEHLPLIGSESGAGGSGSAGFETELMKAEFDRLANRMPLEMLSMRRYELPPPPHGKLTDVRAWQEAMENAQAQLEHQVVRITNLELMTTFGTNSWKVYNDVLSRMLQKAESQLVDIRRKIQEVNWQRKQEQTAAGDRLKSLEETWVGLVGKNYEIEQAIVELEAELGLEGRHGDQLQQDGDGDMML